VVGSKTAGDILIAHFSVRRKLNRVSSVQFSCIALYAPSSSISPIVEATNNN